MFSGPKILDKMPIPLMLNFECCQCGPLSQNCYHSLYPCLKVSIKTLQQTTCSNYGVALRKKRLNFRYYLKINCVGATKTYSRHFFILLLP